MLQHCLNVILHCSWNTEDKKTQQGQQEPSAHSAEHDSLPWHCPLLPLFLWAPKREKTWQWKETSEQSYQHSLFFLHFTYRTQLGFFRTIFCLKLCFLRTLTSIDWVQNAQIYRAAQVLGWLLCAEDLSWHLFCRVGHPSLLMKTISLKVPLGGADYTAHMDITTKRISWLPNLRLMAAVDLSKQMYLRKSYLSRKSLWEIYLIISGMVLEACQDDFSSWVA